MNTLGRWSAHLSFFSPDGYTHFQIDASGLRPGSALTLSLFRHFFVDNALVYRRKRPMECQAAGSRWNSDKEKKRVPFGRPVHDSLHLVHTSVCAFDICLCILRPLRHLNCMTRRLTHSCVHRPPRSGPQGCHVCPIVSKIPILFGNFKCLISQICCACYWGPIAKEKCETPAQFRRVNVIIVRAQPIEVFTREASLSANRLLSVLRNAMSTPRQNSTDGVLPRRLALFSKKTRAFAYTHLGQ